MASRSRSPGFDEGERCEDCDRVTDHDVDIEIRTEAEGDEYEAYSREPYRVTPVASAGPSAPSA